MFLFLEQNRVHIFFADFQMSWRFANTILNGIQRNNIPSYGPCVYRNQFVKFYKYNIELRILIQISE